MNNVHSFYHAILHEYLSPKFSGLSMYTKNGEISVVNSDFYIIMKKIFNNNNSLFTHNEYTIYNTFIDEIIIFNNYFTENNSFNLNYKPNKSSLAYTCLNILNIFINNDYLSSKQKSFIFPFFKKDHIMFFIIEIENNLNNIIYNVILCNAGDIIIGIQGVNINNYMANAEIYNINTYLNDLSTSFNKIKNTQNINDILIILSNFLNKIKLPTIIINNKNNSITIRQIILNAFNQKLLNEYEIINNIKILHGYLLNQYD